MLILAMLCFMELLAANFAVKSYWKYRVKDLGSKKGAFLKKSAITLAVVAGMNLFNFALVVFCGVVAIEILRNQLIARALEVQAETTTEPAPN